jgi:flagellar protein FliJ
MSRDALATLLRIRRSNLDDAQRAVADALREQQLMQGRREAEEARYAQETAAALDLAAGDEAVDAFARWLPVGRKAIQAARAAEQEASGEVDRARIVLGLARAAHRSVELLAEKRAEEARRVQDRKAQQAMDDLAPRPRLR